MKLKELICKVPMKQQVNLIIRQAGGTSEIHCENAALWNLKDSLLNSDIEQVKADADELIIKVVYL